MAGGHPVRDLEFRSQTLPRGTFIRSIFDSHLIRLSDRGGASQLIGAAWSDIASRVLETWVGNPVPTSLPGLANLRVSAIHRLDTVAGVARRASKAGLKNPDFVVFATREDGQVVFGVDAKFSVETAKPIQVSAETTTQLFEGDSRLMELLPDPEHGAVYVDGLFLSPDYSLTHAMFRQKIGHTRLSVTPRQVVLAETDPEDLFGGVASCEIIDRLAAMDGLDFPLNESLLAFQYYFRLERSIVGLVAEEQKPLLGTGDIEATQADLIARIEQRADARQGAWQMILDWDREVDHIRRQRQALHQVVGTPISGSELRDLSDRIMDEMGLEQRPSRNQVRKMLGAKFTSDVLSEVGVILPPVRDFTAELERVATAARHVSERYSASMSDIVREIIVELTES